MRALPSFCYFYFWPSVSVLAFVKVGMRLFSYYEFSAAMGSFWVT